MLNNKFIQKEIQATVTRIVDDTLDITDHEYAHNLLNIIPEIHDFHFVNGATGWCDGDEEETIPFSAFGILDEEFDEMFSEYLDANEDQTLIDKFDNGEFSVDDMLGCLRDIDIQSTRYYDQEHSASIRFNIDQLILLANLYVYENEKFHRYIHYSKMLAMHILKGSDGIVPNHVWFTTKLTKGN